jgi:hypothetical protein
MRGGTVPHGVCTERSFEVHSSIRELMETIGEIYVTKELEPLDLL